MFVQHGCNTAVRRCDLDQAYGISIHNQFTAPHLSDPVYRYTILRNRNAVQVGLFHI
jgi:hypothetical protein